jgi:hypothetical protein
LLSVFETSELTNLVGVQPIHLNKFIERGQYGITASVRTGRGRGRRRIFNEEDVFGVALVWWLFETGLRSGTIQYVINQICGGHLNSRANDAAQILLERQTQVLLVKREPRSAKDLDAEYPKQRVYFFDESRASQSVRELAASSVLVVPVGNLFSNLKKAIQAMLPSRG